MTKRRVITLEQHHTYEAAMEAIRRLTAMGFKVWLGEQRWDVMTVSSRQG